MKDEYTDAYFGENLNLKEPQKSQPLMPLKQINHRSSIKIAGNNQSIITIQKASDSANSRTDNMPLAGLAKNVPNNHYISLNDGGKPNVKDY